MKRFITVLLVLLMPAIFLTGCDKKAAGSGAVKVYLITMDKMDAYWNSIDSGCRDAVSEIGADKIEYLFDAPERKDNNAQINKIENAVANGADYILLAANDPEAQNGAIQAAASTGVKFIFVDAPASWPGALATITPDNRAAGKAAGEQLLAKLAAAGVNSGAIGVVNVNAATASTALREEGFRSAFAGKGYTLLATQYGEGDVARSQEIASNYITQGVVGLFGCNEGSTVGIANAIQEAGGKVLGAGFDTGGSVLDLIDAGLLICTMAQNPGKMGYEGIKAAYTDSTGGTLSAPNIDSGVTVVTKENSASFR
jgi:ribose transport system substrate-binding protein